MPQLLNRCKNNIFKFREHIQQADGAYLASIWQVSGKGFPEGRHIFSSTVFLLIFDWYSIDIRKKSNNNRISIE